VSCSHPLRVIEGCAFLAKLLVNTRSTKRSFRYFAFNHLWPVRRDDMQEAHCGISHQPLPAISYEKR